MSNTVWIKLNQHLPYLTHTWECGHFAQNFISTNTGAEKKVNAVHKLIKKQSYFHYLHDSPLYSIKSVIMVAAPAPMAA